MQNSVAFVAAPYGFGPSSIAIAISSFLPRSIKRVYFGDGPPLEIAKRSNEFSTCLRMDFSQAGATAAKILSAYDIVILVNSMRFVPELSKIHKSLIFVDTLAWLRESCPPCLHLVKAYFAQSFFRHRVSNNLTSNDNFNLTGAIVPKTIDLITGVTRERLSSQVKSPVIHCGGLFSPAMCKDADIEFVHQLMEMVKNVNEPLRIILPKHLHHHFKNRNTYISVIDCSPITVHKYIIGSLFALTTSGIEFSYESMIIGIPTLFLPPFNASQHIQLNYYKQVFQESIFFQLDDGLPQINSNSLDEVTVAIQKRGMSGVWRNQFKSVGDYLERFLVSEKRSTLLKKIGGKQTNEIQRVGHEGAGTIVTYIIEELNR